MDTYLKRLILEYNSPLSRRLTIEGENLRIEYLWMLPFKIGERQPKIPYRRSKYVHLSTIEDVTVKRNWSFFLKERLFGTLIILVMFVGAALATIDALNDGDYERVAILSAATAFFVGLGAFVLWQASHSSYMRIYRRNARKLRIPCKRHSPHSQYLIDARHNLMVAANHSIDKES